MSLFFFFFNDTATTEIYTLSLHDALPISTSGQPTGGSWVGKRFQPALPRASPVEAAVLNRLAHELGLQSRRDRKSTRLNSSHGYISYAVFCFKKKKKNIQPRYK